MKIRINFASREHVLAGKVCLALFVALAAGLALFTYSLGTYGEASSKVAGLAAELERLNKVEAVADARLSQVKKAGSAAEVKFSARQAEFANTILSRRSFSWTALLNRLEDVVPPGVGIDAITPDYGNMNVSISGTAEQVSDVTEFAARLTKSPYFEDVPNSLNASERLADKDIGKMIQNFSISIRYIPEGQGAPAAGGEARG